MSEQRDDQDAVFAFLDDPRTHGGAAVARIDTHAASVFLAGADAYKVKRAVRFAFLDFSTLDKRHAACAAELEVNRANAPDLYLGLVPITRTAKGFRLGGTGEVVEWAVHMRRFDETQTLDRLAPADLSGGIIDRLATRVLESHARAPERRDPRWADAFMREARATLDALAGAPEHHDAATFAAAGRTALDAAEPALRARCGAGAVRRCHGDLHLRNVVLIEGEPVLFDAIEFNEDIATCDTLYDFAFLLMDLLHRGLREAACRLLNRYLWGAPDIEEEIAGLALLPLFLSLRAGVRAKVALDLANRPGAQTDAARAEAAAYLGTAARLLGDPAPARLIGVGGLSGTGKSTLAAALAPQVGAAPGAVHLRSDIERKRLLGRAERDRLPPDAYRPEVTRQTYARLLDLAARALEAGRAVVVDAVHAAPQEREALAALAAAHGVPFDGLWLEAPVPLLQARVEARRDDASDATGAVVARQSGYDLGPMTWTRLDASAGAGDLKDAACALLRAR